MWIKIVAGCLREALRAEEPIGKLYELIGNLPDTSLDDLFHQILQDLGPRDLNRAANYIGFMKAHNAVDQNFGLPLPAMLLYFADELDLESSTSLPFKKFRPLDPLKGLSIIRGRINSSCKGLLDYVETSSNDENLDIYPHEMAATIQYPHRSVKDYLNSPRAQIILSKSIGPDPHLRLCSAYLLRFKSQYLQAPDRQRLLGRWTVGSRDGLLFKTCIHGTKSVFKGNNCHDGKSPYIIVTWTSHQCYALETGGLSPQYSQLS